MPAASEIFFMRVRVCVCVWWGVVLVCGTCVYVYIMGGGRRCLRGEGKNERKACGVMCAGWKKESNQVALTLAPVLQHGQAVDNQLVYVCVRVPQEGGQNPAHAAA